MGLRRRDCSEKMLVIEKAEDKDAQLQAGDHQWAREETMLKQESAMGGLKVDVADLKRSAGLNMRAHRAVWELRTVTSWLDAPIKAILVLQRKMEDAPDRRNRTAVPQVGR